MADQYSVYANTEKQHVQLVLRTKDTDTGCLGRLPLVPRYGGKENGWAIPRLQWKGKIKRRVFTFSVKPA